MRKKLYLITTLFTLAAATTTGCGSSKENTANANSGNEAVATESNSAESDGLGDSDTSSGAASSDNDNSSVVASSESEELSDAPASGSEAESDEHTANFSVTTDENGNEEVTIETDEIKTDENGQSYVTVGDVDVKVEVTDGKVIVADENVKEAVKTAVKESNGGNSANNSNTNNTNNSDNSNSNNGGNSANSGTTDGASKITVSLSNDNGKVVVSTPTPTPKVVAKVTDAVKVADNTVTKSADTSKNTQQASTPTCTPTPTKKPASTTKVTSTPTSTPTKAPTKVPTSTPKPTATPTPKSKLKVKYFLVMKDITVETWVSNDSGRNGNGIGEYSLVNYYFLNDTAPDYPYITSHTHYDAKTVKKFIDRYINNYGATREEALESMFISACDDDYQASYTWKSNYVIGQEEVKVEVIDDTLDFEDTTYGDGFPTYGYYEDWSNGDWATCASVKDTVGCVYSDGTTEHWTYNTDGSIKTYLTKLK